MQVILKKFKKASTMKHLHIFFLLILTLAPTLTANDGPVWVERNFGLAHQGSIKQFCGRDSDIYAATGENGVFKSISQGADWTAVNSGLGQYPYMYSIHFWSEGYVFAGTNDGDLYRSVNNGMNWENVLSFTGMLNFVSSIIEDGQGVLYAGSGTNEIHKSTNGGSDWERIDNGLVDGLIWCLAADTDGNLYAGTHNNGVYRSSDGANWEQMNTGLDILDIHVLKVDDRGAIWAGCSQNAGLYKSTDNGNSWYSVNMEQNPPIFFDICFVGDELYAATSRGVLLVNEEEETWEYVNEGISGGLTLNALYFDKFGYLYAGSEDGNIYRSEDPVVENPNNLSIEVTPDETVELDWGGNITYEVKVTDGEGNPVEYAMVNMINGLDNGMSGSATDTEGNAVFEVSVPDSIENDTYNFSFSANKTGYVDSETIIRRIKVKHGDQGKWEIVNTPVKKMAWSFIKTNEGTYLYGTGGNGFFRSEDGGESWTESNGGLIFPNSVHSIGQDNEGSLYASTDWEGPVKSTDDGKNWVSMTDEVERVAALTVDENGHIYIAGFQGELMRSSDKGQTWEDCKFDFQSLDIRKIENHGSNIFIISSSQGLYSLEISNEHWEKHIIEETGSAITSLDIDPEGSLWACVKDLGVFKSTDGGNSWNKIEYSPDSLNFNFLRFYGGGHIFGTDMQAGAWYSSDGGNTFTEFNEGLEGMDMKYLVSMYVGEDGTCFAGGYDRNLYHREFKPAAPGKPGITISTDYLNFGEVTYPETGELTLTIESTGSSDLEVKSATLTGSGDVFSFVDEPGTPAAILAPGSSFEIDLLFAPEADSTYTCELIIESTDPDNPQITVTLTGHGRISGIDDNDYLRPGMSIYPNPTGKTMCLNIENPSPLPQSSEAIIYDNTGKVVKNLYRGILEPGENAFRFDISGLASGQYILVFRTGKTSSSENLIIQ